MSFDLDQFLTSGQIEDYCLGNLSEREQLEVEATCAQYPAAKAALLAAQTRVFELARSQALEAPELLNEIFSAIDHERGIRHLKLNDDQKLDHFSAISSVSDITDWARLTESISAPDEIALHMHELYSGKEGELHVIWLRTGLDPEIHTDELESILVLEGHCTGYLGNEAIAIRPGDFIEIPLHAEHSLKVESDFPAKLILMRRKVA